MKLATRHVLLGLAVIGLRVRLDLPFDHEPRHLERADLLLGLHPIALFCISSLP
jgi:hypothetical protein